MQNQESTLIDHGIRERIRTELATSFCVEAGAGTGKTTLLVDRILSLIVAAKAEIEQIAAITFTEKAAAELKLRVRDELEIRRKTAREPELLPRLDRALTRLDYAQISTIHSFASSLLKERPIEAGVDPDFAMLDPIQQDILFDQYWDEWMEINLEQEFDLFSRASRAGLRPKDIRNLAVGFHDNRDLVPLLRFTTPVYDIAAFYQRLTRDLSELESLLPFCRNAEDKGQQAIDKLQQALADFDPSTDNLEQFLMKELEIKAEGNQRNWQAKQHCDRQKGICRSLRDDLESLRAGIRSDVIQKVSQALKRFLEDFQRWKFSRGILDFQDLLILSRNLLRNDADVRRYFQNKYRYILVDEFQDTDPLQVELIFYLGEQSPVAEKWNEVRLSSDKLFLVGDPKQSIYRFRRADIEIFERAKQKLGEVGETVRIRQNFRSVSPVVDWVNGVFQQLMTRAGNYAPEYVPIGALAESPSDRSPHAGVYEITAEYDETTVSAEGAREVEASALVQTIAKMLREEWRVRDPQSRQTRPVQFGDIAFLFPTYYSVRVYEDALRRAGFPYLLEGGKQYYQRQEVRSLINCLQAIDNPADELAVYGALHSIFFGISDQELFLHHAKHGGFNYLEAGADSASLAGAFEILRRHHESRNIRRLSEIMEGLYRDTQIPETLTCFPYLRQSLANLQKVLQQARDFERLNALRPYVGGPLAASFQQFVRWLDRLEQEEVEETDSLVTENEDDVIRLMSIHKAKGLEFPIVFLVKLHGDFTANTDKGTFVLHYEANRLEFRVGIDREGYFTSAGFDELMETEGPKLDAERRRLLYVAATRARDYLFLPRFFSKQPKGYAELLGGAVSQVAARQLHFSAEELSQPMDSAVSGHKALDVNLDHYLQHEAAWKQSLDTALGAAMKPNLEILTATGEKTARQADYDPARSARHGQGISLGARVHALLEKWDFRQNSAEGVESELVPFVDNFLSSGIPNRALAATRYWREMPFAVLEEESKLLEGMIDLVIEEADGLVVIDYKTDNVNSREEARARFNENYRGQGAFYRRALERAGLRVKSVEFLFLKTGHLITDSE